MDFLWRHYLQRKKNDHVFHNTCLNYVIKFYDDERATKNQEPIQNNMLHVDNCPTQHKCRQNFIQIATYGQCNGSDKRIIHKFASKHAFKGPWDATGKIVKSVITKNEFKFERCSNAFQCYLKLKIDLNKKQMKNKIVSGLNGRKKETRRQCKIELLKPIEPS